MAFLFGYSSLQVNITDLIYRSNTTELTDELSDNCIFPVSSLSLCLYRCLDFTNHSKSQLAVEERALNVKLPQKEVFRLN